MELPDLTKLTPEARDQLIRALSELKASIEPRKWESEAYFKQLPPENPRHGLIDPKTGLQCGCKGNFPNFRIWLVMTGRGFGKTRTGANWILERGLSQPNQQLAICGPTYQMVRDNCFTGNTGILRQAQPGEILSGKDGYNKNELRVTLRNGTTITGYSADRLDTIRGQNISYCWFDEIASVRYPELFEEALMPALRGVTNSQMIITTTPKTTGLLRDLLEWAENDPSYVHLTTGTSMENWKDEGVAEMIRYMELKYAGNRVLIAQEIAGEFQKEISGALFEQTDFDKYRILPDELPELRRVVIGVDPASSAKKTSDEHGIVVCGEDHNSHLYTLEDCSTQGTPDKILHRIVAAHYKWESDLVVVEDQVAGDWFRQALYDADPFIPFKPIHAMKSKKIRAQPLSPLNERGQIHMVGESPREFETLERQLSSMTPYDDRDKAHDDRADAWVYAMRELARMGAVNWKEQVYGFVPCVTCGRDVNVYKDATCRHCGTKVQKPATEKSPASHLARRWSEAYYNKCEQGHEFPMRLKECPECNGNPAKFIAEAMRFSGKEGNWHRYNRRNWFAGRKF